MAYDVKFSIVPSSALAQMDYSFLTQDNEYRVRRSLDGTMAVVGWNGEKPDFIVWPVLTHAETLEIMATDEWTNPEPDGLE